MFGISTKTLVYFSITIVGKVIFCSGTLTAESNDDPRPICRCGSNVNYLQTRVVGGHNAIQGLFPYATGLVRRFLTSVTQKSSETSHLFPYCGGTLITDKHVLTAAHCVRGRESHEIFLDISDYDIDNNTETQRLLRNAISLIKYPDYVAKSFNNDIAVVELDKPVILGSSVKSAWLPAPHSSLSAGSKATVYGWGRLLYSGGRAHILQSLELPLISNEECQKKYKTHITERMVCAGGEAGKDACIGDSGSGLIARIGNDYVLYGIVSFGRRCAEPHIAGVYTKVSYFVDWIHNVTDNASCRPCIASTEHFQ